MTTLERIKTTTSYQRMAELGIDLSWVDRSINRKQEAMQPYVPRSVSHPQRLVCLGGGHIKNKRFYFVYRVCPKCHQATVQTATYECEYPLIKSGQIKVIEGWIPEWPRECPAQKKELIPKEVIDE